jgi:hypothetical protein
MQNFYERSLSVTGYLIKSSEKTEELISQLIIVIVEIKYFLNLNEYYLPIFILSIHFRQISLFKITKDIQSNNSYDM